MTFVRRFAVDSRSSKLLPNSLMFHNFVHPCPPTPVPGAPLLTGQAEPLRGEFYSRSCFHTQLIADFSPGAGNGMKRKLEHALSLKVGPGKREGPNSFVQSDHS